MKIGFWGYPHPDIIENTKKEYPNAEWVDLDIDFNYPKTNILPEAYCKIIRNIIDNSVYLKPDLIIAPIGKDKCDSGWFASKILSDMGFKVVQSVFEELSFRKEVIISKSKLPLIDKINNITGNIIYQNSADSVLAPIPEHNTSSNPQFVPGFWGVPPNDLSILELFPDTTHVYGWTRCVEAGAPADIDLEMYVNPKVPTVFYSQAFCSKAQLAKYLADKYNGLYIDINDYATTSVRAKIEAFLRLN